jgi:hypothetical protein
MDDPVTRRELERAIRSLNLADVELRDVVLQLAARVVSLSDELTRRLDGVEPLPAAPNTAAPPPEGTIEAAVESTLAATLEKIRAGDAVGPGMISLDTSGEDKYTVTPVDIPCAELIPLCHARCCTLTFALSTADLDEGVVRWDYGQPYLIRQRASDGFCVHNDPDTHACEVHEARPRVCRAFDCRDDDRVWIDYEKRIPAPFGEAERRNWVDKTITVAELVERSRARALAIRYERHAISESFADAAPKKR